MAYRMDYRHTLLKYLFWCLVSKFAIDLTMLWMASQKLNSLFLYNTYVLVSFVFIAAMIIKSLDKRGNRRILKCATVVFYLVFACDWIYWGPYMTISIAGVVQCLMLSWFVILYFWEVVHSLKIPVISKYPFFWACAGILINYAPLAFVVLTYNPLDRWGASQDFRVISDMAPILESFACIVMGFGFLKSD